MLLDIIAMLQMVMVWTMLSTWLSMFWVRQKLAATHAPI
jgi:hypothetical protein